MGYGMAMNIRKKIPPNSTLYINDINKPACDKFIAEFGFIGPVKYVDSPREVADNALVIISIVPSETNVKQVYLESQTGIIAAKTNPNRLMLECSTISVESTKDVGETLKGAGAGTYIDTPVSVRIYLLKLIRSYQ